MIVILGNRGLSPRKYGVLEGGSKDGEVTGIDCGIKTTRVRSLNINQEMRVKRHLIG